MKRIKLTQNKWAVVDNEDYERVNQYKWCAYFHHGNWYAVRWINKKPATQRMHNFIMNCPKGLVVDHRNHNGFDNRRCNLRICTTAQNNMNQKLQRNTSSKYKGVSWYKRDKKWMAYIRLNGKRIYLGYYINEIDAAKTYDKKAKELFGKFAYLNLQ